MQAFRIPFLMLALVFLAGSVSALEIVSPTNTTYNETVAISLTANQTQDSISYEIVPGTTNDSCMNCSSLNDTFFDDDGTYTLFATTVLGNETTTANVTFSILQTVYNETNTTNQTNTTNNTVAFSFVLHDPENVTYTTSVVPLRITANETLDSISYSVNGGASVNCVNCSSVNTTLNLTSGTYNISAVGALSNVTETDFVQFTVAIPTNGTNNTGNQTNNTGNYTNNETPRFTVGLNKLPQDVAAGLYTDAELAAIIRTNELNPGIINRLVKTSMLGNESIDAILETQKTPPGIWNKVVGFFGFTVKTPKEKLADTYALTDEQKEKLVASDDIQDQTREEIKKTLPPGLAKKMQTQTTEPTTERTGNSDGSAQVKNEAPGQAKKNLQPQETRADEATEEPVKTAGNSGKVPPGLAKKNN
jgi:hypothetical protein